MVFGPALEEMVEQDARTYGPVSFRDYVADHGIESAASTPYHISVNALEDLARELRESNTMVLRMGAAPEGTGTLFLLVRASDVDEFFLVDEEIFAGEDPRHFEPPVDPETTIAFQLLPSLSETSLVNLGLASGVLSEALDLDTEGALMPPATGLSTFTFDVRPHSSIDQRFEHRRGQVEIDTMFAERRNGERVLFVIEAKTGTTVSSLAKHKLAYPALAIADAVPSEFEIVPVYIRVLQRGGEVVYRVAECQVPDPRQEDPAVDEVEARRGGVWRVEMS